MFKVDKTISCICLHTDRVNLALSKPAKQSSNYQQYGPNDPKLFYAPQAVDGSTASTWLSDWSCNTMDSLRSTIKWWMVDLQNYYQVEEIIVYSRSRNYIHLRMQLSEIFNC